MLVDSPLSVFCSFLYAVPAMRMTKLFTKTSKNAPHDADSVNARLLVQAGYVDQLMAGVYSYLPLGFRVLRKIQNIVREEMDAIGAQEILMPALHPADPWKTTGRWTDPGPEVMFQFIGAGDRDLGLGWTHEEIVTPLAQKFIRSYKDLPFAAYQVQDKFRNEPRAKSGILRGREFNMKDLYSFHRTEEDLDRFYETVWQAYQRIFGRCGIRAIPTEASGGSFSKVSHEFQMPTEAGEDVIFMNQAGDYAWNREIVPNLQDGGEAPDGSGPVRMMKAIEVGNIFKLKTKYTEPFGVWFDGVNGSRALAQMGCYGIGPSRIMGAIVEASHDERGIIWPESIAPYRVHLVSLKSKDKMMQERILGTSEEAYGTLAAAGVEVLWDDRPDISPGEKFGDADLLGLPLRLVVSEKTLKEDAVEWKRRTTSDVSIVKFGDVLAEIRQV